MRKSNDQDSYTYLIYKTVDWNIDKHFINFVLSRLNRHINAINSPISTHPMMA